MSSFPSLSVDWLSIGAESCGTQLAPKSGLLPHATPYATPSVPYEFDIYEFVYP